ncbi:hypothetical protein OS493_020478 [Desmophyllum pertusum]|uniref:Uncharacterized protein n=1 Tax=Desmophyllum pertusum TaxID=174260 RepID=A0A9W9ZBR9_9CNID|nr:hypothetical protein OS493_020478 [Desmophyllum pertusum]
MFRTFEIFQNRLGILELLLVPLALENVRSRMARLTAASTEEVFSAANCFLKLSKWASIKEEISLETEAMESATAFETAEWKSPGIAEQREEEQHGQHGIENNEQFHKQDNDICTIYHVPENQFYTAMLTIRINVI